MLEQRDRRAAPVDAHLEPYPDEAIAASGSRYEDPAEAVVAKEAVGLAFIAAMQLLPPRQRAVLVLRDVLDVPAREVADWLGDSVPAVNSALQRARARLARERQEGSLVRRHDPTDGRIEAAVMRRFQDAWEAVDIAGLVGLLADDALMTMPPEAVRVAGASEIGTFFATQPMEGRLERIRLRPARVNSQPGLAAYAEDDASGSYRAYGFMVFAIAGDKIVGITGFPERPDLFERLGLPGRDPCLMAFDEVLADRVGAPHVRLAKGHQHVPHGKNAAHHHVHRRG
jgi:RNA polymerase sigma-70 factor, ECF subfamily